MSFTPAELRLLRLSDRLADDRVRDRAPRDRAAERERARQARLAGRKSVRGQEPTGRIGTISDAEAIAMMADGKTYAEIARHAGVGPSAVDAWRRRRTAKGLL